MQLREGYKQTEVGIIPEDWEIKLLPEVSRFRGGKAHEQYISPHGQYVCVNSKFISTEGRVRKHSSANFCSAKYNDVLMVMSDLPNGKALAKAYLVEKENTYAVNQRVCALTALDFCSPGYLFYKLNRYPYFLKFDDGVTQTHLLNGVFAKCPIPLPPTKAEQEAIAEALSDTDAWIESLEQLIAKKRRIKEGSMQALLTGKQRLPGFSGEWEVKTLGEVADFTNGKPHEPNIVNDGRYFLITLDSIAIDGSLKKNHKRTNLNDDSLQKDDIVTVLSDLAHGNLLGLCDLVPENGAFVLNQRMGRLRLKVQGAPQFIRLQVNRRQNHFKTRGQGTSQRHIYKRDFDCLEVPFPAPAEQTAIAAILSDMDTELDALEAKLRKARQIKQGMMQELLTGKTRLV